MEPRHAPLPGGRPRVLPRTPRAHEKGRAKDRIPDDAPAAFEALEAPHAIAATPPNRKTKITHTYTPPSAPGPSR